MDVIIYVAMFCVVSFILCYCFDEDKAIGTGERKLWMPTLYDVKDLDESKIEKYVTNVIVPASRYFDEKSEISEYTSESNSMGYLGASTVLLLATTKLLADSTILCNAIEDRMLRFGVVLVMGIILMFLISVIYQRTPLKLSNKDFEFDKLEMESLKNYKEHGCEFSLGEREYVNKCLIVEHLKYIQYMKKTIIFRHNIRYVIMSVTALVYLLFFAPTDV